MHYLLLKKQNHDDNLFHCEEIWDKDLIVDYIIEKGDAVIDYDIYEVTETICNHVLEKEFELKTIQKEIMKLEKSISEFPSNIKSLELDIETRKRKNELELLEFKKLQVTEKKLTQ